MDARMPSLVLVGLVFLSSQLALGQGGSSDHGSASASQLVSASPVSSNTIVDRIRSGFKALLGAVGFKDKAVVRYTTAEAATAVFDMVARRLASGETYDSGDVPVEFEPTDNNRTEEYSRGSAFAKLKELIETAIAARQAGTAEGVFVLGHNFILRDDETGRRVADLFIRAHQASVPVLLSFDWGGTILYGGVAPIVLMRLWAAGIPLHANPKVLAMRMDHRKVYFIGMGNGHVAALCGGQGWDLKYAGPDWESMPALPDNQGCVLYGEREFEPWLDHMRLVDGEAAIQGVLNFLGRYIADGNLLALDDRSRLGLIPNLLRERVNKVLGVGASADLATVGATLRKVFYPQLKRAGDQTVVLLHNTSWDHRPITEVWYRKLSDPDVREIRIAMPYITDPVFRKKLREAVKDGKDIHILVPGVSDNFLAQFGTQYLFRDLISLHRSLKAAGKPTGRLRLREWRSARGKPHMLHMKYGIFTHRQRSEEDTVIDGSYNATGLEARVGEANTDVLATGRDVASEAAMVFDTFFNQARDSNPSWWRGAAGLMTVVILRPLL